MTIKCIYIDTETTGQFEHIHRIWDLAAIYEEDGKLTGEPFSMRANPGPDAQYYHEALTVCGVTQEYLESLENSQEDLFYMFREWLQQRIDPYNTEDKAFFIAYNGEFDMRFCRSLWKRMNDNYFGSFFWFPDMDVMRITHWALMKQRHILPNFKLMTVAKAMGIPWNDKRAHGAMYDCRVTRKIWQKLNGTS